MLVGEEELSVVLQASIERAQELLEADGGFLPFGARAGLGGEVEFLEASGDGGQPIDALYRRIGEMLAEDAGRGEILAAALVANASLPEGIDPQFETAISVLVEAAGFCRSIVVPYRLSGNGGGPKVEFGEMIPEEADPVVFATPAS